MKHYILYNHGGCDNHGCEAIVRSTVRLLGGESNTITLSSMRPEADFAAGIDQICKVCKEGAQKPSRDIGNPIWLKSYLSLKLKHDYKPIESYYKIVALDAKKGDTALSIGGDNYCYAGTEKMAERNQFFQKYGLKTVLWGCSVEPSLLQNDSIAKDLASFNCILARESISYEALKKINPNTYLVCDPAFLLETSLLPLPSPLKEKEYVAINVSPLVSKSEKIPGITSRNYISLIDHILSHTAYNILLLPHVVSYWDDDREVLKTIYSKYENSGRVVLLEDTSCTNLKGFIARSKFLITARTHASIAGYSTCVPTLVLGYSVKSTGIARDLFGTEEGYVVPVQNLSTEDELLKHFSWLVNHEQHIIKKLQAVLPDYSNRIVMGADLVKKL